MTTTRPDASIPMNPAEFADLTDNALLQALDRIRALASQFTKKSNMLEYDIIRRAQARGALAIDGDAFEATLKIVNSYDQGQLQPLLEVLSAEDLAVCYTAEHVQTTITKIAAKFDLVKLKPIARKRGYEVQAIIDRATIPGSPKVTLVEKHQRQGPPPGT